jgi:hypothetical protein
MAERTREEIVADARKELRDALTRCLDWSDGRSRTLRSSDVRLVCATLEAAMRVPSPAAQVEVEPESVAGA